MKTVNTPLLDAALTKHGKLGKRSSLYMDPGDGSYARKAHQEMILSRWQAAKMDLALGLGEKRIYNVVYAGAKETLGRQLGDCLEATADAFGQSLHRIQDKPGRYEVKDRYSRASEAMSSYCAFNQAKGRIKLLEKFLDLPYVRDHVALLQEIHLLQEVIQGLKPFVIKGRRPSEKIVEVDLTNTGHCAICANVQKMTPDQTMVHHGFTISAGNGHYIGFRDGSCFGVGYKPYEISCEANQAYLLFLAKQMEHLEDRLKALRSRKMASLVEMKQERVNFTWVPKPVVHAKGTEQYEEQRRIELLGVNQEIRSVRRNVSQHELKVSTWKHRPLFGKVSRGDSEDETA